MPILTTTTHIRKNKQIQGFVIKSENRVVKENNSTNEEIPLVSATIPLTEMA